MIFEFLIACHAASENDIYEILRGLLTEALEDSQDEFDDESIAQMVRIGHRRFGGEGVDGGVETIRHVVLGLTLELPDMDSVDVVASHFANSLPEPEPIFHVVRFEDPLLKEELARYANDIFALEMKLRRVLSFIYLHAYQREEETYDLLKEEQTRPVTPQLRPEQMASVIENQFFHLTFSQYINLNNRLQPDLNDMRNLIRDSEQYDTLRNELLRSPLSNEQDTNLLNDLKELMEPIEQMRNCVAHNRRPNSRVIQNYSTTRPRLEERLNEYLSNLEQSFNSGSS